MCIFCSINLWFEATDVDERVFYNLDKLITIQFSAKYLSN